MMVKLYNYDDYEHIVNDDDTGDGEGNENVKKKTLEQFMERERESERLQGGGGVGGRTDIRFFFFSRETVLDIYRIKDLILNYVTWREVLNNNNNNNNNNNSCLQTKNLLFKQKVIQLKDVTMKKLKYFCLIAIKKKQSKNFKVDFYFTEQIMSTLSCWNIMENWKLKYERI